MIGRSLKKIRIKKKFTQKELAERLGVSRQAICLWESNKREVKATRLKDIARILSVTVNDLMRTPGVAPVKFSFKNSKADQVELCGNFNDWQEPIEMRRFRGGLWRTTLDLTPGRYEYKFIVDGEWCLDPDNDNAVYNECGTLNSVKEI